MDSFEDISELTPEGKPSLPPGLSRDGGKDYVRFDLNDNEEAIDSTPDLETALKEVFIACNMFFDNKFDEAIDMCAKWETESLYHSLGKSYFRFIYASFTFEAPEMTLAKEQLKTTMTLCQRKRKHSSLSENLAHLIWRPDFDQYTDEEVHAELVNADLDIMMMQLVFLGDQNLMSLIKGAFRMRSANKGYKFCNEIMKNRTTWTSEQSRKDFEAGTCEGLGTMNLIFSHLPSKILKLLTVVGFSGDRELGLQQLHNVTDNLQLTIRYKVAEIIIVLYNLYIEQMFGFGEGDIEWAQTLTDRSLTASPNGAFALFCAARLQQLKGHPKQAIECFEKCISAQSNWKQIHNICYWDLCWCHAIRCEWDEARRYAHILREQCFWSPATNMYQVACFLYMKMDETGDEEMKGQVLQAMRTVPELKIRYAGKTLPPEKFATTKANRYLEGDQDLTLPALELFYMWNIFGNCGDSPTLLEPILRLINAKVEKFEGEHNKSDGYCLALLLKGVCLRASACSEQAIDCFGEILENESNITKDTYLPPQAAFELGITYLSTGNLAEARIWLEKARDDYSGFLAETLVHLRVHGALTKLKKLEAEYQPKKRFSIFGGKGPSQARKQSISIAK